MFLRISLQISILSVNFIYEILINIFQLLFWEISFLPSNLSKGKIMFRPYQDEDPTVNSEFGAFTCMVAFSSHHWPYGVGHIIAVLQMSKQTQGGEITCHVPAIHQDVTEQVDLNLFTTSHSVQRWKSVVGEIHFIYQSYRSCFNGYTIKWPTTVFMRHLALWPISTWIGPLVQRKAFKIVHELRRRLFSYALIQLSRAI